jgi:hypothetical protein
MTTPSLLRAGWTHLKEYAPPVMAAALMYGGIHQILSAFQYPLSNYAVKLINLILRQAFRDVMPLAGFGAIPWLFYAKVVAEGVIIAVVGMFIGLWVQARSQHRPTT